jgi:signal transduction histidine kinase
MAAATDAPRLLNLRTDIGNDATVMVTVRDSGVGLDPAHRERVFDAFHTTKPRGMGMGLTISRSIIESHGGKLWATANPDRGETFRFTVPWIAP